MNLFPHTLAEPKKLYALAQSLAMLDAIICPDWEYRCFNFDAHLEQGQALATINHIKGDSCLIWFSDAGVVIKGYFVPPYPSDIDFPQQIKKSLPDCFQSILNDPIFYLDQASFCYWYSQSEGQWHKVEHGGSRQVEPRIQYLLRLFNSDPNEYQKWAKEYFESYLLIGPITAVYNHSALTKTLVRLLNPCLGYRDAKRFATEIDYPCANI